MIRAGRSVADEQALRAALAESREVRTRIDVLMMDGTTDGDLTDLFVDGQVNWHADRPVSRSLQLSLADDGQSLPTDSDSPADAALDFRRMLRVWYDVLLDDWVETPVFTGPVTYLRAKAGQVYVECQGKERLGMGACWAPMTLGKYQPKTDVIMQVLSERAGETMFDIPDDAATLPAAIGLDRHVRPWVFSTGIAASMGKQLYYDGLGVCRLRPIPSKPVFSFDTDTQVMPGGPKIKRSSDIYNAVYVYGATPDVSAAAVADALDPLSPLQLGRNGVPLYLAKFITDATINNSADAQARADRELAAGLIQGFDVQFEAHPVGFELDPLDVCNVTSDDLPATFPLRRASFPLAVGVATQPMTIGYVRDVTGDRSARR